MSRPFFCLGKLELELVEDRLKLLLQVLGTLEKCLHQKIGVPKFACTQATEEVRDILFADQLLD